MLKSSNEGDNNRQLTTPMIPSGSQSTQQLQVPSQHFNQFPPIPFNIDMMNNPMYQQFLMQQSQQFPMMHFAEMMKNNAEGLFIQKKRRRTNYKGH